MFYLQTRNEGGKLNNIEVQVHVTCKLIIIIDFKNKIPIPLALAEVFKMRDIIIDTEKDLGRVGGGGCGGMKVGFFLLKWFGGWGNF